MTVTLSANVSADSIRSVFALTNAISASAGLQLTPLTVASGNKLYVNYYAPVNITSGCPVTFKVFA